MNIGIDGRELNAESYTGIKRFLVNLLTNIPETTPHLIYVFINRRNVPFTFPKLKFVYHPCRNPVFIWDQIVLPKLIARYAIDVFLSPYNKTPLFTGKCKKIIVIHDIIPLLFGSGLNRLLMHILHRLYLQFSTFVVTVSAHSRDDIINQLHVNPDKVKVIYNFVDKKFLTKHPTWDSKSDTGNYLLYVGNLHAHKNVPLLLSVYHKLIHYPETKNLSLILVVSNGKGLLDLKARCLKLGLTTTSKLTDTGSVIILNQVDDNQLISLYREAVCLVFPSLYEGFGAPLVEAMACKCPIICSDRAAVPEIVGDAGIVVNPDKENEWCAAILHLYRDKQLRTQLIARGEERVKKFTPAQNINGFLSLFQQIAKQ